MKYLRIPVTNLVLLLAFAQTFAQSITYDDVAVIVNDNSPVSQSIGNYFAQQRNLPAQNVIHITTSTDEVIDSITFRDMQAQIENALRTNNLADSINYLVTTKGLPLMISKNGACDSIGLHNIQEIFRCSCVESELPLILSPDSAQILQNMYQLHQYHDANAYFDRDTYGIFLVSRLDGYTEQDVRDLIDRSGPNQLYFKPDAKVLLDQDLLTPSNWQVFQQIHDATEDSVAPFALTVINDTNHMSTVNNVDDLIFHNGVYDQPDSLQFNHSWQPGAMAHYYWWRAGVTFYDSLNVNGDYLLADVLREGATVLAGYVHWHYLGPSTQPWLLADYYLDSVPNPPYNAAESYYMASQFISGSNLLIGDPKTSIFPDFQMEVRPVEPLASLVMYPNPSPGQVRIDGNLATAGDYSVAIYNEIGQQVYTRSARHNGQISHALDISAMPAGMYVVAVHAGAARWTGKLILQH